MKAVLAKDIPENCAECEYVKLEADILTEFIPRPKACFYAFNRNFDLREFDPYKKRPEWCPRNAITGDKEDE